VGTASNSIGPLATLEPLSETQVDGRYEPKAHAIVRRLREAILDGRLPPGLRVGQEALARQLGVSRIPVREALRQLEIEGLVTLRPHSGATVASMDWSEHVELYRIREALEPLVIAESTPLLTDAQLEHLDELVAQIERATDDLHAWLEHDRSFHLASYAAAPRPRMLHMIDEFWNSSQQYRRAHVTTIPAEELRLVNDEHRVILEALHRRDAIEAETRLRLHLRRTRITLARHPDLFVSAASVEGDDAVTVPSAPRARRRSG
jgi:DNA-binding GntR family transcriptional regulator